jgi:hypothetical protein
MQLRAMRVVVEVHDEGPLLGVGGRAGLDKQQG